VPAPSPEDFDRWRDDFVTRWVFKALETAATAQQDQWNAISWDAGVKNPASERQMFDTLRELRTRADAYRAVQASDYSTFCDWNNEEPNVQS
jgi:hypothetical protein